MATGEGARLRPARLRRGGGDEAGAGVRGGGCGDATVELKTVTPNDNHPIRVMNLFGGGETAWRSAAAKGGDGATAGNAPWHCSAEGRPSATTRVGRAAGGCVLPGVGS
jgi:hypothetical protein